MKIVTSLLLLLFVSASAYAQTPQIERIDTVEYGIYTADKTSCKRDAEGIQRCGRSNLRHAETTSTVPAQLGVEFGLRYRVVGNPNGAPVQIKRIWRLPTPGFRQPGKAAIHHLERVDDTTVGGTLYVSYGFDDPWELIPGPWVLEFWYGDRKLLSHTFTVVRR
ncbi:MAG TPA: DUF3859 domain-containing protein [Stellaceae bacterium]|jgi:hypothetical protein